MVITNSVGSRTSAVATLGIIIPPANLCAVPGSSASFTVSVLGATPTAYQWYRNDTGHAISGATTATLTLNNVQPVTNGGYFVRVTSGSMSGYSDPATLTVGYQLTTAVVGRGRVYSDPAVGCFAAGGSTVRLYALPEEAFRFSGWSGSASGTANPLTVVMDASKSITATFTSSVPDIILDNPSATFSSRPVWATNTGFNSYGANHRSIAAGVNDPPYLGTAKYSTTVPVSGYYDLSIWYPNIASLGVHHANVYFVRNTTTTNFFDVNQSSGGGQWNLLYPGRYLSGGSNVYFAVANTYTQASHVVFADAFKMGFVRSAGSRIPPYIKSVGRDAGGNCVLAWFAVPGEVYRIQGKTNLSDAAWTDVSANLTAWSETPSWTNPVTSSPRQFFRVAVP